MAQSRRLLQTLGSWRENGLGVDDVGHGGRNSALYYVDGIDWQFHGDDVELHLAVLFPHAPQMGNTGGA